MVFPSISPIKISIPYVFKGNKIRPGAGSGLERVNIETDLDGELIQMALVYKSYDIMMNCLTITCSALSLIYNNPNGVTSIMGLMVNIPLHPGPTFC